MRHVAPRSRPPARPRSHGGLVSWRRQSASVNCHPLTARRCDSSTLPPASADSPSRRDRPRRLVLALGTFVVVNARVVRARAHRTRGSARTRPTIISAGLVQGTVRRALIPTGRPVDGTRGSVTECRTGPGIRQRHPLELGQRTLSLASASTTHCASTSNNVHHRWSSTRYRDEGRQSIRRVERSRFPLRFNNL